MIQCLTKEHGFVHIDVEATVRGEAERCTDIGNQMTALIGTGAIPTSELICKMLCKILYCGKDGVNKFIMT